MKFSKNNKDRVFKIILVISSNKRIEGLQGEYTILRPIFDTDGELVKLKIKTIHNVYIVLDIINSWEASEYVMTIMDKYNEVYRFKAMDLYIN